VDANASEHKLTISGSVPTEAIRARALEIARGLQPGFEVTAKVDVKPMLIPRAEYSEDMAREAREKARAAGRTVGDSLEDAWIHTTITTKLAVDRDTPVLGVNVDVMNQAVTLRGTVDTATAKSEAERIAKETDGVKSVQNLLMVK
jgi:osmotically-inducible protein OsmY